MSAVSASASRRAPGAGHSYWWTGVVARGSADDRPRRFDLVLPREERGVAFHRFAEEPLVGVHLVAIGLVHDPELRRLGGQLLAGRA